MMIMKRWIALVLSLILCLTSLPLGALAEETVATEPVHTISEPLAEDPEPVPSGTEPALSETEQGQPETEAELSGAEPESAGTEPEPSETESAKLISLTVKTLPTHTDYLVGETVDLTGLVLLAEDETGEQMQLTPADGITLLSGSTAAPGEITVTVGYEDLTASFRILVHDWVVVETAVDVSGMSYNCSGYHVYSEKTITKTCPKAEYLKVKFSSGTYADRGLTIWDGAGNEIATYYNAQAAGKTVTVPGDTVKIQIKAFNDTATYSGFKVESLIAGVRTASHVPAGDGVYHAPTCYTDGYTVHTCLYCRSDFRLQDTGSARHTYSGGFCVRCGYPENPNYFKKLTDTVSYAFTTADKTLYLCGEGAIPDNVYEKISLPYSYERVVIGSGITSTGAHAFRNRTGIKSVSLPAGLAAIGGGAFNGCTGLTEISVPGSVTDIGGWAFYGCTGLTGVSILGSVAVIGSSAFEGCTNLTTVNLASGLREIGHAAFKGCAKLSAVTLPATLAKIGGSAFVGCTALTAITIPDSVTELGDSAFRNCSGLKHIYIPAGVATIPAKDRDNSFESGVFLGCSGITVYCGAEQKPEGWGAYWNCWMDYTATNNADKFLTPIWGCSRRTYEYWTTLDLTGVEDLVIPDGIDAIPNNALSGNRTLKSVTMPDSVKHIGDRAFYNCTNIAQITLSANLKTIGNEAFYSCSKLKELEIPEGVASIGYCFLDSTGVRSITLPSSLKTCGYDGTDGMFGVMGSNVRTVTFAEGTKKIPDYALCRRLNWTGGVTEVNLPESLEYIGNYAFHGCYSVDSFDLPDSVTTIGNYAFAGCVKADRIDLPDELLHIGSYAFQGCTGVDFAVMPDKVRDIGDYAFKDCTALETVTLNEGLLTLGSGVFYNCKNLTQLKLPSTLAVAGHYYQQGPFYGSYIEEVTVAKGMKKVPAYLFASDWLTEQDGKPYSRITTVEFEDLSQLTDIGEYAYYGCINLYFSQGICGIPGTVREIRPYTFYGCKKIERFQILDGVTSIGEYAFYGCGALHTVNIPDSVKTIGTYAFGDCKALHAITIPAGATVGDCAYEGCTGATSLTIGDTAVIGRSAFFNCKKLKSITIGKGVTFLERPFGSMHYYGSCTDTLSWDLNMETGLLTISGTGPIPDYSVNDRAPWHPYVDFISDLQIGGDVTAIGNRAFEDLRLLESITLHDGIRRVGESAFSGCRALRYVQLPGSLQTLEKNAFEQCSGLETVQFMGNAPALGDNCFGTGKVEARYPSNAMGYTSRLKSRYPNVTWTPWEASQAAREIVILMDTSSDMTACADTMVQAVDSIIDALGGAHRNTRIALAGYRNSADILCGLTTDTVALEGALGTVKERIPQNSAYAGVKNGLDLAYGQLMNSGAEGRYVILLTAQTPDDNRQAWITAAQTLRSCATLFTVGISATDGLRKDLTDMAGSADRYFDVEALDDLIAQINRPELPAAAMEYMGKSYDLLTQTAELSLVTEYTAEIHIRPGKQAVYADTASIALRQDGRILQQNETGDFTVHPGSVFVKDKAVEAVFFDASGTELAAVALKLTFRDSFTVTYVFAPDVTDPETGKPQVYFTASHAPGTRLTPPENPERQGYLFKGWYTSTSYGGYEFFDPQNAATLRAVNADMTLYGKWQEKTDSLIMGVDTWRFLNSHGNFTSGKYGNGKRFLYESTIREMESAMNIGPIDWMCVRVEMGRAWGGSCKGMSTAVVLAKAGILDIEKFVDKCRWYCNYSGEYTCVHDAVQTVYSVESDMLCPIEDMLNFYHYRQKADEYLIELNIDADFRDNESKNLKKIIKKMSGSSFPVEMSISVQGLGGHSVVAFDLEETGTGYRFQVYDCSLSDIISYPVTVTVNEDGDYIKSCPEWDAAWRKGNESKFKGIKIKSCSTVDDLDESMMMLESGKVTYVPWAMEWVSWEDVYAGLDTGWADFVNRPRSSAPAATAASGEKAFHILYTSGGNFTITSGSHSAVIRDGEKISGNLPVVCMGLTNYVGEEPEYGFALPALPGDGAYTITQSGSGTLNTRFRRSHADESKDFLVSHSASAPGELTLSSNGTISTRYETETAHTLQTVRNDSTAPWSMVEVSGTGTGFCLTQDAEKVDITSDTETTVRVTTTDFITESTLDAVPVSETPVEVAEGENAGCVATRDGEIVASSDYGYSVVFLTNGGSEVESILNVTPGALVAEPEAPARTGFVFTGWYTDEACTEIWDFSVHTVDANVRLYAGWEADPDYVKSVTFRISGREDQIIYLSVGSLINPKTVPLSHSGEMLQWYETETFMDEPWDFARDKVQEHIVLYGRLPLHTVTFVTGCNVVLPERNIPTGSGLTAPEGLQNPGHTLCGWYADPDFTALWDFDTEKVASDLTLYARWLPNELDVQGTDTGICIEIVDPQAIVYTGKALKPRVIVRDNGVVLTEGKDYTISYKNNTNACRADDETVKESKRPQLTITGKGNYKARQKITKYFTILPIPMASAKVTIADSVAVKSGNKLQKLTPKVSTGLATLPSKAYTIRYFTDGALTQEVPGLTAPGSYYVALEAVKKDGAYTGNATGMTPGFPVQVVPSDRLLSKAKITLPKTITACTQAPAEALPLLLTGVTMGKARHETGHSDFADLFTVTAVDADGSRYDQSQLGRVLTSVGRKTLYVTAKPGNPAGYAGEKSIAITVKGITLNKKQFLVTYGEAGQKAVTRTEYSGIAQTPDIFTELVEGVDYRVTCRSGKKTLSHWQVRDAGSYTLELQGMGRYTGKLSYSFSITKVDLAKAWTAGKLTITTPGTATHSSLGALLQTTLTLRTGQGAAMTLLEGRDYTLKCSGNKNVTTKASATLTGKGNFSGSLSRTKVPQLQYTVQPKPLTDRDITITVTGITYKKNVVSAVKFAVYDAGKKLAATQYTGSFTAGEDTVVLTVTGRNKDYTGLRRLTIDLPLISATDRKKVFPELVKGSGFYYTGNQIRPEVTILDAAGKDISACFHVTYGANTNVGTGTVTITGNPEMGYYGTKTLRFTILPKWSMWLFG